MGDAERGAGRLRQRHLQRKGGDAHFAERVAGSVAAGHHDVAIDAATLLVLVTGRRLSRPEVMQSWGRHAEALITRTGTLGDWRAISIALT